MTSKRWRAWPWWGAALLLGVGWGALDALESRVVQEAVDLAAASGLELTIDGLAISPLGRLTVERLEARRQDGSKVIRVGRVTASWRLLDLLRGREMPAELVLMQPAAELRLVDGKPVELQRGLAALRARLGRRSEAGSSATPATGWPGPDRIRVHGGVFRVQPTGVGAQYLPAGVLLRDLNLALDSERGGKISCHVDAPMDATLRGTAYVDDRGGLWLSAAFGPAIKVPLPRAAVARLGADTLSVAGMGWSPADGPHLTGVVLSNGFRRLLTMTRLAALGGREVKLRADGLIVRLQPDQHTPLGKLLATMVGDQAVSAGQIELGSVTGRILRGLGGARRLEVAATELVARLPGGLGQASAAEVAVGLPRAASETFQLARATVRIREPRLAIRAPDRGGPQWLGRLRALGLLLAAERARPLASVASVNARLEPGWQRPGTVSAAARRARLRQQSEAQRKNERLAKMKLKRQRRDAALKQGAYTRRLVPPLNHLRQRLIQVADALRALQGATFGSLPEVHVEGGEVSAHGTGWQLALTGMQGAWQRTDGHMRALSVTGGLGSGATDLGRWRVSTTTGEPSGAAPLNLHLQGGELARIGRALWPHLGVGDRPKLQLDLALRAGAGRERLHVHGDLSCRDIGLDWRRFSPVPHTDFVLDGGFDLRLGAGREGKLGLEAPNLRLGLASLAVRAEIGGTRKEPVVDLRVEMPEQDCGRVADSIPRSLLPTLGTLKASGQVGWWMSLHLDLTHPYFSELDLGLDDQRCEVRSLGRVDVEALAGSFRRKVNEDGFELAKVSIGPTSGSWTPMAHMPRWLPYAMTTTEDGSFYSHRGLNVFLLNRAIRLDLHYGRFVYGGSTLTQQLVKNLYMTRSKYLGRKLEELLIVWHMERTLPKARILEIYTNAVEFGPGQYGVTRGARHYFDKTPGQITPLEAAWLGSIKPCPACADGHFRAQRYGVWYQTRLLEILTRMEYYGVITKDQYDREMNTVPRFARWPAAKLARRFDLPVPPRKVNAIDLGKRASEVDEETLQAEAAERREKMRLRIIAREQRLRAASAARLAQKQAAEVSRLTRLEQRRQRLQASQASARSARQRRALAAIERKLAAGKTDAATLAAAKRRADEMSWEEKQRRAIAAEAARLEGKPVVKKRVRRKRARPQRVLQKRKN